MKIILATIFLLVFNQWLIAQDYPKEYGKISGDEYEMTVYDQDPDAAAVVLYDMGNTFFKYTYPDGYNILFTKRKRIKILKTAGLEYAEVQIPYYVEGLTKAERIVSIKAMVYNAGKNYQVEKIPLDESTIFDEKVTEHWRVKKFALPGVRVGSIIEFEYELWTPFHFNLPDWEFQSGIPTIFSQYTLKLIPFYEYVYTIQGDQDPSIEKKLGPEKANNREIIYTFTRNHIPAFEDESFITSKDDYISKLDFQLAKVNPSSGMPREIMSTWPKLIEEYLKLDQFGKYIKKAQKIAEKEIIPGLNLSNKSELEKSKIIIDYLKQSTNWNEFYGKFADNKAQTFWTEKSGSIGDLNLFAVGALQAAGITAHPLVLSTRDHGKINRAYPFSNSFNYVIVLSEPEDKLIMSDVSEPILSFDRVPPRCINDLGLIIQQDKERWVELDNSSYGSNNHQISIDINPDSMKLNLMVNRSAIALEAYDLKKKFENDIEGIISHIEYVSDINVHRLMTKNYDKKHVPYSIAYSGETPLEVVGDQLIIKPFLSLSMNESPLKTEKRTYPVDFIYRQDESFISLIKIPKGYKATYLPNEFKLTDNLIDISYLADTKNSDIMIKGTYEFKKSVYNPSEYAQLKKHLNTIVTKFNDSVILQKSKAAD